MSARRRPARSRSSGHIGRCGGSDRHPERSRGMIAFAKLCQIVARLRAPGGCPWDAEQTNESLLPPLIEEAYEVAGAIRAKDDANLREELGDLILLAVMQSEIANETGRFHIDEVLEE